MAVLHDSGMVTSCDIEVSRPSMPLRKTES
jgi:hypothetical protein